MPATDNLKEFGTHGIDDEDDGWLLTYADMVTLLLCFFAVMIGISKIDMIKVEQMTAGFSTSKRMTMKQLSEIIEDLVVKENLQEQIDVQLTSKGVEINMKDKLLFDIGSADLKQIAFPVLAKLTDMVSHKDIADRIITIEGHTDSLPIKSERFPSNWELSSARAASVVRYFIREGQKSKKFESIGYADTIPKVEETAEKKGLSANRRVVIIITPDSYMDRLAKSKPITFGTPTKKKRP